MDSMIPLNRRLLLKEGDNTEDSSHSEETNFDTDMVVMLAALLCALVAALILNSAIHILLRRRRESMEVASNMQPLGLEKHALKKIPVAVFRLRNGVLTTECSICLGEFVDGEKVRVLPECSHEFHVKCIDKWLKEHTSCPNCRRCLVSANVVDGKDRPTFRVEHGGVAMV
ncbi:Zinc finger, RING/FYVE/PHD-type [Artemisia annua]|uniref:RING-type E3 ubiquitin transferase n=1 Tax=Artemisia annua TaxID=35608 RepID=A0A2U1QGV4_ARTAN|nr:Zinc finger, RING/FYVE/PHD-type [Artemisia annua]